MFLYGIILHRWNGVTTHDGVDGRDDGVELIASDDPVSVYVVQAERPLELLAERPSREDRQTADEILQRTRTPEIVDGYYIEIHFTVC